MLNSNFAILGALCAFIFNFTYVVDTFKGRTQPNRVTWVLWTLAPMIAFAAEIMQGVGVASILTFAVGFGPLLVVLASLLNKKAYWHLTKFDVFCGSLSVLAIILWLITGKGDVAIIFSILADFLAALPTIIKAYKNPETESYLTYFGASVGGIITLLTVTNWTFSNYAFDVYIMLNMGLIGLLVALPKFRLVLKIRPRQAR